MLELDGLLAERWYESCPPWNERGYVYEGSDDPHQARFVCDCDDSLILEDQHEEHRSGIAPADRAEAIVYLRNHAPDLARAYLDLLAERARTRATLETLPAPQGFDARNVLEIVDAWEPEIAEAALRKLQGPLHEGRNQ